MRPGVAALFLVGLLAAPLAAARAGEAPALRPTRDVDITYMMARPQPGGGWQMLTERQRWSVAAGKLRVDPPTPGLWMVIDLTGGTIATVQEGEKRILDGPAPQLPGEPGLPGENAAGQAERRGPDRVGDWSCTDWAVPDTAGRPALLCLTDDGVLLRASLGGRVLLEALELTYAPQPEEIFRLPTYRHEATPVIAP